MNLKRIFSKINQGVGYWLRDERIWAGWCKKSYFNNKYPIYLYLENPNIGTNSEKMMKYTKT